MPNVISTNSQLHQSDNSAEGLTESADTDQEYETLSSGDAAELHLQDFMRSLHFTEVGKYCSHSNGSY